MKQKNPYTNVKSAIHKARYEKMNTTTSLGTTAQGHAAYTTVRHLTLKEMKDLKIIKFITSKE